MNPGDLIVSELSKSFGDYPALNNVSFTLPKGKLLVALGPSGCGKTTLLRLIAGLEAPDHGQIYLGPARLDILPPGQRDVSLVFQNYALYPHMTVAENLGFPLKVKGVKRADRKSRVTETAQLLALEDHIDKKPGQLSGGQRQRVALGRAIIRNPKLFLFDEPLSNLDTELRARMRREIVRLQRSLDTSAVYVTHDQTEALTMADIIVILNKGSVHQIATPDEIYRTPADTFVAGFIGAPKMNFIHCRLRRDSLGRTNVEPFNTPFETLYPKARDAVFSDGEAFILGVRPEAVIPGPLGEFHGRIKEVEFLGDRKVATMFFKDSEITYFTDSRSVQPGAEVKFNLKKESLHFFDARLGKRRAL